jgi:hypothetical protein
MMPTDEKRRRSDLILRANPMEIRGVSAARLGQSYPIDYPQVRDANDVPLETPDRGTLGAPLSIRDVARLIGCSAWTVRQRHLPQGLPYFRSGPAGKLIFYRNQVVAWILRQQKGGK